MKTVMPAWARKRMKWTQIWKMRKREMTNPLKEEVPNQKRREPQLLLL